MKIRTDFVTNSSASSFVIWGIASEKLNIEISEDELEEKYDGSMREYLDERCNDTPLTSGNAYYADDTLYIGVNPGDLIANFSDRKIGEIKQIVADEIEKVFGVKINSKDVGYIEEASYDG